jgi:hypothetical protein
MKASKAASWALAPKGPKPRHCAPSLLASKAAFPSSRSRWNPVEPAPLPSGCRLGMPAHGEPWNCGGQSWGAC